MGFHWGNENVRTRQELAIHCVYSPLTVTWLMSRMLGEVYLLKENELLTHVPFKMSLNEFFKVKESDSKSNNHLGTCPEWIL